MKHNGINKNLYMSSYDSDYLPSNILGDKYQIERELASQGARKTLLARNIEQDILVIIKLLIFGNEVVWDNFKLFEREAETLKSLSHPAIPQYLDYFEIEFYNLVF
ncbi:MAG: hypothetical protein AAGE84_22745 [Cyanobacteria bacterium P01_G01_bin.39]